VTVLFPRRERSSVGSRSTVTRLQAGISPCGRAEKAAQARVMAGALSWVAFKLWATIRLVIPLSFQFLVFFIGVT
jgi:hypothetical protein